MKYKVGDKVRIKSIDWYNENKDKHDFVHNKYAYNTFVNDMAEYCGKTATITHVTNNYYHLDIDNSYWSWNDFMFEDKI